MFVHVLLHFLCFKNANRDLNEGGPRPSGRDTTPQCPFIWFVIRNLFISFYRFKHANHDINEGAPLQFAIGSFSSIALNERIPTERGGQRRKRPKTTHRGPSTLHPTINRTCRRQIQTKKTDRQLHDRPSLANTKEKCIEKTCGPSTSTRRPNDCFTFLCRC